MQFLSGLAVGVVVGVVVDMTAWLVRAVYHDTKAEYMRDWHTTERRQMEIRRQQ